MVAKRKFGVVSQLDRAKTDLIEPACLDLERRLQRHVRERISSPRAPGSTKILFRVGGQAVGEGPTGALDKLLKAVEDQARRSRSRTGSRGRASRSAPPRVAVATRGRTPAVHPQLTPAGRHPRAPRQGSPARRLRWVGAGGRREEHAASGRRARSDRHPRKPREAQGSETPSSWPAPLSRRQVDLKRLPGSSHHTQSAA